MSAILRRIDDPRSPLDRARKYELEKFCKSLGWTDVEIKPGIKMHLCDVPAELIRRALIKAGHTNIKVPPRPLGAQNGFNAAIVPDGAQANVRTVDALDDFASQVVAQRRPAKPVAEMSITELRMACKQRGIKMARTDNMGALRAKLNGQDAA